MNGFHIASPCIKPERFPDCSSCSFGAYAFQSCVRSQSVCLKSSHHGGKLRCLFLRLCTEADLLLTIIHRYLIQVGRKPLRQY